MKRCKLHFTIPTLVFVPALALLMSLSAAVVQAQVVQLPAVRNFSYSGSAWVPDAGTASLGGSSYSASSSVGRGWGPYSSRASGAVTAGSSLSASVQIIDLQALDDAILSANIPHNTQAPKVVSAGSPAANGGRQFLTTTTTPHTADRNIVARNPNAWRLALAGVSSAQSPQSESLVESDIRFYLKRGKEAEQANRILSARVYYRMAMEAMTPEMVERYRQILEERKALEEERRKANRPGRIKF